MNDIKHRLLKPMAVFFLCLMMIVPMIGISVGAEESSPQSQEQASNTIEPRAPEICDSRNICGLPVGSKIIMGSTTSSIGGDELYSNTKGTLSWIVVDNYDHYINFGTTLVSEYTLARMVYDVDN